MKHKFHSIRQRTKLAVIYLLHTSDRLHFLFFKRFVDYRNAPMFIL